jgi:ABC-type polysaccharide/polyol phosphate export permease
VVHCPCPISPFEELVHHNPCTFLVSSTRAILVTNEPPHPVGVLANAHFPAAMQAATDVEGAALAE